jgi:hypothetical protein
MLKLESLVFNPFSENTFIIHDETKEKGEFNYGKNVL